MTIFFYNKDNKRNLLLSYETSSYNNIPRIGEKVVIENKWYLIEDIVNTYMKPSDCTFAIIDVYLKKLVQTNIEDYYMNNNIL